MRSSRRTPRVCTAGSPALDPAAYNGFHLAYADGTFAGLTWSDGSALRQERLEPGVHVLTEQSLGAGDDGARRRLVASRVARRGRARAWRDGSRCSREHGPEPRAGTCVHADAVGYGTRSAFVLHRATVGRPRAPAPGPSRAPAPPPPATGPRCSAPSAAGSLAGRHADPHPDAAQREPAHLPARRPAADPCARPGGPAALDASPTSTTSSSPRGGAWCCAIYGGGIPPGQRAVRARLHLDRRGR